MDYRTIELRRECNTGWVRIDRPEVKNALNARFFDELQHAVDTLAADDEVRVLVFVGNGGNFSVGRDFKDCEVPPDFEERRACAFCAVEYCEKPTIAAVAGYAVTGGLTLATIAGHDAAALRAIKRVINDVVRQEQRRILDLEELAKRRFHDLLPENGGLDRGLRHLDARDVRQGRAPGGASDGPA